MIRRLPSMTAGVTIAMAAVMLVGCSTTPPTASSTPTPTATPDASQAPSPLEALSDALTATEQFESASISEGQDPVDGGDVIDMWLDLAEPLDDPSEPANWIRGIRTDVGDALGRATVPEDFAVRLTFERADGLDGSVEITAGHADEDLADAIDIASEGPCRRVQLGSTSTTPAEQQGAISCVVADLSGDSIADALARHPSSVDVSRITWSIQPPTTPTSHDPASSIEIWDTHDDAMMQGMTAIARAAEPMAPIAMEIERDDQSGGLYVTITVADDADVSSATEVSAALASLGVESTLRVLASTTGEELFTDHHDG